MSQSAQQKHNFPPLLGYKQKLSSCSDLGSGLVALEFVKIVWDNFAFLEAHGKQALSAFREGLASVWEDKSLHSE